MADSDTIREAMLANAAGPKKVTGDTGSVEQHSIKDLIEAEKFAGAKEAVASVNRGLRFTKLVPPGAT